MKKIFLILLSLACAKIFSQPGTLDKSFSNDGEIRLLIGSYGCGASAVTMQPDGKILLGGYYENASKQNDLLVVRLNKDGSLDKTFSGNGAAKADFAGFDANATAVVVQSDLKIVAIGSSSGGFGVAARFNADGSTDNSFGTGGKISIQFDGEFDAAALQPDGKIVVAGTYYGGDFDPTQFAVFRFNSNGSLDNSFGNYGMVFTNVGEDGLAYAHSMLIQPDGKIVVGGQSQQNGQNFGIVRYNSNGSLDVSFGNNGIVITPVGSGISNAVGYGVTIQPDGKILQAGFYLTSLHKYAFVVLRYNTNGSLDNSFAGNGKAPVIFSGDAEASSVALQSNGEIIVAGSAADASLKYNVALARLKTGGAIDNSFGSSGEVTTDFGGDDHGNACVIQSDGKVVVAGTRTLNNENRIIASRYLTASSFTGAINNESLDDKAIEGLHIKIYPNPVSDILHIDGLASSPALIKITDASGNVLKQIIAGTDQSIDMRTLHSGYYILSIMQDGKISNQKFIKQ